MPTVSSLLAFALVALGLVLTPAMLYLSLLSQFVDPARGSVLTQSLVLGGLQIAISLSINALIAVAAGTIAAFLGSRPVWMRVQRWLMGTVLAGLGLRMALESRK